MRRLATHLLTATLAFGLGLATYYGTEQLAQADETMPPAPEYELASPLPTERVCEVHGVRMHTEQVPLRSINEMDYVAAEGLPESYGAEVVSHFPHAEEEVLTNYDRSLVDDQTAQVYVCPLCRAAKAAWLWKHRAEICTC